MCGRVGRSCLEYVDGVGYRQLSLLVRMLSRKDEVWVLMAEVTILKLLKVHLKEYINVTSRLVQQLMNDKLAGHAILEVRLQNNNER